MNFNIDRDDNIFFDLKKWYDVEKYEEYKDPLTYNGMDLIAFINTVNALNKYENGAYIENKSLYKILPFKISCG